MRIATLALVAAMGLFSAAPAEALQYVANAAATFRWSAATGPVEGYAVYVSHGFGPFVFAGSTSRYDRSYQIPGVPGERIRVRVAAFSGSELGPMSPISDLVAFVVAPPPELNNPSFEAGPTFSEWVSLGGGSRAITGWEVIGHSVDVIDDSWWLASQGRRSLDLAGDRAGGVRQSFATVAGQRYLVTFDLSANPWGPEMKVTEVSAAGAVRWYSSDGVGMSRPNLRWSRKGFAFTATSSSTTLQFRTITPDSNSGPALDNVAVQLCSNDCTSFD